VSKQTISTITDKVMDGMAERQNRPLDPVYPVIFIDCVHVKVRDGQVANRPVYVALAVTVDGHPRHLRLVGGRRRRGRQVLAPGADRDPQPGRRGRVHGRRAVWNGRAVMVGIALSSPVSLAISDRLIAPDSNRPRKGRSSNQRCGPKITVDRPSATYTDQAAECRAAPLIASGTGHVHPYAGGDVHVYADTRQA
jgi:hypothetical protein